MAPFLSSLLADFVLLIHAGLVLFVVLSQALILIGWWCGWQWTRQPVLRGLHLAVILVVAAQAWLGVYCPLTLLETSFRQWAGEAGYPESFIGYWIYRLLYYRAPWWMFTWVYSLFTAVVLLTWWRYPPQRRR